MADPEGATETRSSHELRLTEKGREYQTGMKLKVFKQMLSKLEKDGTSLLDELTTQDENEQTNEMAKKVAKCKHNHLLLVQTNEDLRLLLGQSTRCTRPPIKTD